MHHKLVVSGTPSAHAGEQVDTVATADLVLDRVIDTVKELSTWCRLQPLQPQLPCTLQAPHGTCGHGQSLRISTAT